MQVGALDPDELVEIVQLYNFRTLLLDLNWGHGPVDVEPSNPVNTTQGHIRGAYWLPELARELAKAPNAGSATYSILMNNKLSLLMNRIRPEVLIVYDSWDERLSKQFCALVHERLLAITEDPLWHRVKFLCYLNGGIQSIKAKYPQILTDWLAADEYRGGNGIEYEPNSNRMPEAAISQISPHLFISGIQGTGNDFLNKHEIRHVLSIGEEPDWSLQQPLAKHFIAAITPRSSDAASAFNGVMTETVLSPSKRPIEVSITEYQNNVPMTHYLYSLEDVSHAPIHKIFTETTQIIRRAQEKQEPVLVHCFSGQSRSSSVVIAYMMLEMGMTLCEAFALTFQARPFIRPNTGFWARLQHLESDLLKKRKRPADLAKSRVLTYLESSGSTLPPSQLRLIDLDRIRRWLDFRSSLS